MSDIKHNLFFRKRERRWVLSYVPRGGTWKKPRQVTAPDDITSEKRARAWADGELAKIRAGGGVHPERKKAGVHSLRDVHERLMAVRESHPDTKAATIKNNWAHLRAQILGIGKKGAKTPADPIADLPMADLGVTEARAFVRRVRARVSANHCRNIVSTARSMWDVAIAENIVKTANPFRNEMVVKELPKQRNASGPDPITVPTRAAQALLDWTKDSGEHVVPLSRRVRYALAMTSGLDDGELAGLTWGAIDLAAEVPFLKVTQAYAQRTKGKGAGIQPPKTENRRRTVPLHPAAVAALLAWRETWEMYLCKKPRPTDFLFTNGAGGPYRPKSAEWLRFDLRALNHRSAELGEIPIIADREIEPIEFKATRRTFSSLLKNHDVDKEDRGKLMGHSGESVTERNYTRHELGRLAELVGRIPLRWPSVDMSVATIDLLPQTRPGRDPDSAAMSGTCSEVRMGFEPTYVGFAKGRPAVGPRIGRAEQAANTADGGELGIGTGGGIGLATGPAQASPTARADGRLSVDVGDVRVSTDVSAGEPLSAAAARLALSLRQLGVPSVAIGDTLQGNAPKVGS